jgi:hypothetical protein
LDGRRAGEDDLSSIFEDLIQVLQASGAEVQVWTLRELKLAYCIGCFGCWLETPGLCRYNETGRTILQQIAQSDTIILFTPVVFGGYSSQLKQIVDRFACLILPYFNSCHGELHHAPRYARYPRWIGIGVQDQPNAQEAGIFKLLVGRNAINYHAPNYAAEVVQETEDPDRVRAIFQALLSRKDKFLWGDTIKPLFPAPDPIPNSPYLFWRWMATYFANQMWVKRAAGDGVSKRATFARSYA